MEHIIKFNRGYDCIKFQCIHRSARCQPSVGGSHGKHGLEIRFISRGIEGAVQFLLYTGWLPQHAEKSNIGHIYVKDWGSRLMPADLGYHAYTAKFEGQYSTGNCECLGGKSCYYDGSGLNASDAMYALVNGGDLALWQFLDTFYSYVFHGTEYPKLFEYEMPIREKL